MKEKPLQIVEEHLFTESSAVKKSIYNFWDKTLVIIFNDNQIHKYADVDSETFLLYKEFPSKKEAFNKYIKNNFKYTQDIVWKI